jgi:competence ComEA-like helix-hairpin-helix protein
MMCHDLTQGYMDTIAGKGMQTRRQDMKSITNIFGVIIIIMLASGVAAYGADKAGCGQGATGQGVSSGATSGQSAAGQGAGNQGVSGHATPGQGLGSEGSVGPNEAGVGAEGLGGALGAGAGARTGERGRQAPETPGYQEHGQLNINTASADELILIPGIDRSLANRIVEYRQSNGPYDSVDELMRVQGADQKKIDEARAYLKVQGSSNLEPDQIISPGPTQPRPFPQNPPEEQ